MTTLLLLLLALAPSSPLDPLEEAVRIRWEGLDPVAGRPPADVRALEAALLTLEIPRAGLLDDLRAAGPAARRLDRHWPEFDPLLATAYDALAAAVVADRDSLAAWRGRTGSFAGDLRLERGIAVVDRRLDRAAGAERRSVVARRWLRAGTRLARLRGVVPFPAPSIAPAPFAGLAPDFSLVDANPNSQGTGLSVSPRDHAGRVTAWYYTRLG